MTSNGVGGSGTSARYVPHLGGMGSGRGRRTQGGRGGRKRRRGREGRWGMEGTRRGGLSGAQPRAAVNCLEVKVLENPFRSLRTLSAHPSQLEIGVLSRSMTVAARSS